MRAAVLAVIFGCSSSTSPPLPGTLIDIRPLSISWQGKPIARLHGDGSTESVGQHLPGSAMSAGPKLRADGRIILTKPGVTARLAPSGEVLVTGRDGADHPFGTITNNTLVTGSRTIRVEGPLMFFDQPRGDDIGAIDDPVDDKTRHTALVMTAAFFIELGLSPSPE